MVNYFSIKASEYLEERRFKKNLCDKKFAKIDKQLKKSYFFRSPYRISKKYLLERGYDNIHQYGETPLTAMYEIARFSGVRRGDHLLELGAGTGRTSMFLSHYFGCWVTGIERIKSFVIKANRIIEKFDLSTEIRCDDFLDCRYPKTNVIYLYGTCLKDDDIQAVCARIRSGVSVVTTSYSLCDYDDRFVIDKTSSFNFPWGKVDVYLQTANRD